VERWDGQYLLGCSSARERVDELVGEMTHQRSRDRDRCVLSLDAGPVP
jgi:hypothetical protein